VNTYEREGWNIAGADVKPRIKDPDPFLDFDPEKADRLIEYCEIVFQDEALAHLHLMAVACVLCPHDEYNRLLLDEIIRQAEEATQ
jgi:hypothetical protein